MLKAVIFDFDGVILDSFPDQFDWFKYICHLLKKDFPYKTIEDFKKDYIEPVYPDMYRFLGFEWEKEKDTIWKEYHKHKNQSKRLRIFSGIKETLNQLKKKKLSLAIASSNTREVLKKQLKDHGLGNYFDVVVDKENLSYLNGEPKLKPYPDCILIALDTLNCSPGRAIYVGDQPTDIMAVKQIKDSRGNSLPIIAVTYGYSLKEKLAKFHPDYFADKPKELVDIVDKHIISSRLL